MPDITRVFNDETRSLTSVERKYAGQIGDAISTVMHFEYTKLDFLMGYVPYIMFGVYDDDNNPLIFGPAPDNPSESMGDALEDRVYFNGVTFTIPWSVTSRVKSMRVDYQLFFVKNGVEFDGRNVAKLKPTEVLMSAVDSIALKKSISCAKQKGPHSCPPFAPTGAEPNILGWINLWKDYGIVVPVTQDVKQPEFLDRFGIPYEPTEDDLVKNPPIIRLNFRTYNGVNDSYAEFDNVPVMIDGKLLYYQLPYGNQKNTIPMLGEEIGDGKSLIYDADSGKFLSYDVTGIYQFKGTCTSAQLDEMAESGTTLAGSELKNGTVYSLSDRRQYGTGEVQWYEPGTNWVWSEQRRWEPLTGDLDLRKYQLIANMVASWDDASDDTYPTSKLTKDSLDGKVDKVAGKGLSTEDYTTEDKTKLAGIEEGAQVNVIETVKVNGTAQPVTDKTVDIFVPTKTSEISNDSGFITRDVDDLANYHTKSEVYTKPEVDAKLEAIKQFDIKVVDVLPDKGEKGIIYLVPSPNSRTKNVKDEYIWVNNAWEQIGSTSFKLDITQDAGGISVNGTALQDASSSQDGLMTKAMVSEFRGKQDKLTAGTNIVIEDGVISAMGGGVGGGHASATCTVPAGSREVTVKHRLDSYELIFQLRTTEAPIRYVSADIIATDKDNVKLTFSEAPTSDLKLNIIACDKSVSPEQFTVKTKAITSPSTVWTVDNPSEEPVYVQLFDDTGNEIRADMVQNSGDMFTPVVANLDRNMTGTMLIAKADICIQFVDQESYSVDITQYGFNKTDKFLVQLYVDGTGRSMPDIIQDSGTGIISIDFGDTPISGYLTLRKATMVKEFSNVTEVVCNHGLDRVVGVQVYAATTGQMMADIVCTDSNTVTISANNPISGYALIL